MSLTNMERKNLIVSKKGKLSEINVVTLTKTLMSQHIGVAGAFAAHGCDW